MFSTNFDDSCNQNFNNTNTYTRLITSVCLTFPSMFVDTSNYPMSSQHNRHHHIFTKHLVATSNLVWGIFESVDSKSGLRFWMRLKGRSNQHLKFQPTSAILKICTGAFSVSQIPIPVSEFGCARRGRSNCHLKFQTPSDNIENWYGGFLGVVDSEFGVRFSQGSAGYSVQVALRHADVTKQYTHVSNGETLY